MTQVRVTSAEHAKKRVSWTLAQLEKIALAFEARGNLIVFALFVPIYVTITTLVGSPSAAIAWATSMPVRFGISISVSRISG